MNKVGGKPPSRKGKKHKPEACKKISNALKGKYIGDKNHLFGGVGFWKGKNRKEETKEKISKKLLGVNHTTPESIKKQVKNIVDQFDHKYLNLY